MSRPLDAQARALTESALATINEVMIDPLAEHRDRLRAAEQILDRGHGKPLSATIQLPANRRQAQQLAALSDEELMAQIRSSPLPRLLTEARGETYDSADSPIEEPLALASHPLLA